MTSNLWYRIKRKWCDFTVFKQLLGAGPAGSDKISLVLYFDYEREFGNVDAKDSAEKGFFAIIDILDKYDVKATWNCVGLLTEYYPETIDRIISGGHEIASHTYSHIVPLATPKDKLSRDIYKAKTIFKEKFNIDIKGFHSPQDAWSKSLLKILADHNFSYDIAIEREVGKHNAYYLWTLRSILTRKRPCILRIPSVCDDWMFISRDMPPTEMLSRWKSVLSEFYHGKTIAMGFHPWVIGKDEARIDAFESFIGSLQDCKHLKIYAGKEIVRWYQI